MSSRQPMAWPTLAVPDDDQVLGVAQPHVGAVGEAGQADQDIELVGLGVLQHAPDEGGAELRDGQCRRWAPEPCRPHSPAPWRTVKMDMVSGSSRGIFWGVHPGQVLQHADHGGVIVSQHVQLQQVGLHGVIFEVGGDDVGVRVVRRVLHRDRSHRSPCPGG